MKKLVFGKIPKKSIPKKIKPFNLYINLYKSDVCNDRPYSGDTRTLEENIKYLSEYKQSLFEGGDLLGIVKIVGEKLEIITPSEALKMLSKVNEKPKAVTIAKKKSTKKTNQKVIKKSKFKK